MCKGMKCNFAILLSLKLFTLNLTCYCIALCAVYSHASHAVYRQGCFMGRLGLHNKYLHSLIRSLHLLNIGCPKYCSFWLCHVSSKSVSNDLTT